MKGGSLVVVVVVLVVVVVQVTVAVVVKSWPELVNNKLRSRTGKYKFGARAAKHKFGARVGVQGWQPESRGRGQGQGRQPIKGPEAGKDKYPIY